MKPLSSPASRYGRFPLSFAENRGQADPRVKFLVRGIGYSLFLTSSEAVLKLGGDRPTLPGAFLARKYSVLRMRLEGANAAAPVRGVDALPGRSNYFIGSDRKRWRTNVATFAGVEIRDVYPGTDVTYRGSKGGLEYDFALAPGADPNRIRVSIDGARKLSIESNGDLEIETSAGNVVQKAPVIYQVSHGAKRIVSGRYVMRNARSVGFAIAEYDHTMPLVIDPLLSYASYLGGSLIDFGAAIAVDASGDAIVAGYTDSADFPIVSGAFQPTLFEAAGGADDVFISKINAAGTALVYSTYAGGGGEDEGTAVAVDTVGNAYVAGYTMSPDYPVTVGAFQTDYPGTKSAFVTALDQNGGLIYSTFLNGSATSSAAGVAVDATGNAFVTGVTTSTDFPVTAGAYQTSFVTSNGRDRAAFVTKLNPTGTALEYSTYLGPPNYMLGSAIGLDRARNAYVAGTMYGGGNADGARCPATNMDCGFVARLDRFGAKLDFSTLLNLPDSEDGGYTEPRSIAVDSRSGSHAVGDFGVSGEHFGFLQNLDSSGALLNLVNLSNALSPKAIALGLSANIFVAGTVFGNNLASTPGAFQPRDAGSVNAFLNEYDRSGTTTLYSTYLGGSDQDEALGVSVDSSGDAYVTGYTQSSDFPVTPGALQSFHGGGISHAGTLDAFVARIVPSPEVSPTPTSTATVTQAPTSTSTRSATATFSSTPTAIRTPLPTRAPPITSPGGTIDAAPVSLDFHSRRTGGTGTAEFVNLINPARSKLPVTVLNLSLKAAGKDVPVDFTIEASRSTCRAGVVLAAGKSCKVAITFAPRSKGLKQETLMVKVAPGAIEKLVPLLGIGR